MDNVVKKEVPGDTLNIEVGSCIDGRFEVLASLDGARVFLVRDVRIPDRLFALKLCPREYIFTHEFNLRREYILHSHFDHPSIVKVHEPFETELHFGFLMEYMGGGDLHDYITRKGVVCVDEGLIFLRLILQGLSEIHSKNVVHADLKPENILLTSSEKPKITDFGVAREINNLSAFDSSVKGTIKYLCPEYVKTGKIEPTIDVYAVGLIAYELFTGTVPLEFDTTIEMVRMRLGCDMPSLGVYLSKGKYMKLIKAIDKAVKRKPVERYKNASEFLNALPEKYEVAEERSPLSMTHGIQDTRKNSLKNKTKQLIEFA
jgi:serine/threonine protein kinase